jgi:hypothetical protein
VEDKLRTITERDHGRLLGGRSEVETERSSGVEWGAASLALGAVFAILAPVGLFLAAFLESTNYHGFSRSDKRIAALGGYGSVFLILVLVMAGIVFGIHSMSLARQLRRPIALGLAGVLLNGLDVFLWAGAALAWHSSAWNML